MMQTAFHQLIQKFPHLTADGLDDPKSEGFINRRQEFLSNPTHLQDIAQAQDFLRSIGKSTRFSQWQKNHCRTEVIQQLREDRLGHSISPGGVIAGALSLGFTMVSEQDGLVYFNFLPRQIETEMQQLKRRQLISRLLGSEVSRTVMHPTG
jgi:hypothetical protein